MQTKKWMAACAVAGALACWTAAGTLAQTDGNTTTAFRDQALDGVRSDAAGDYVHGIDCVGSTRSLKTGATLLRTASHTVCPDSYWQGGGPALRQMVLDLSQSAAGSNHPCTPIETSGTAMLDPCGPNQIPDMRIVTSNAFASQALARGTQVEIYVSFNPALNNTDFYLAYEQAVAVTGNGTTRTLTAGVAAVAELYQTVMVRNRLQKVSIGRYLLPMQMTIVD
jgi:hypothetical protein